MTLELEHPDDAILFDKGYSWPAEPHACTPSCDHAVITHIDQERGVITFASSPLKPGGNGLVRPMDESQARYLGLLYLEAQGWI